MNQLLEARRVKVERKLLTVNKRIAAERKRLLVVESLLAQVKTKAA